MFARHQKKYFIGTAAAMLAIVAGVLFLPGFSGQAPPPDTIGGQLVSTGADFQTGELTGVGVAPAPTGDLALALQPAQPQGQYISEPQQAEYAFNALGLHWKADLPAGTRVDADLRFSRDGSSWGEWVKVNIDDPDLPDHIGSTSSAGETIGQLAFTDQARFFQYRLNFKGNAQGLSPALTRLTASYIDAKGYHESPLSVAAITRNASAIISPARAEADPAIISRAQWGANEAYMTWAPEYQPVKKIIVHHTVTSNFDPDPAATVRSIYYYHAVSLGWGDIGYNFLIDRQGRIYEGRYGGNAVIGGHALAWNYGSIGIAALGNYEEGDITPQMYNAFVDLMVYKSNINRVDPWGAGYLNGTNTPNYLGHRDIGQTACPGDYMYSHLNSFRNAAYARYAPVPIDVPFGFIDGTQRIPGGYRIRGWAIDPNTSGSIGVHVYQDGQAAAILTADQDRPDVGALFPGKGNAHGFVANISASAGGHTVCVYGINVGPGENYLLNCLFIDVDGSPIGNLESTYTAAGQLKISGWALDPDVASPIDVHVYVNGRFAAMASATGNRPDVGSMYPDYGAGHGFSASVPILAADSTVCAYGINTGGGDNALLGCKTVHNGWDSFPVTTPPAGRHYYWPWYDSAGGSNWVLMASPATGPSLSFNLNIAGKSLDLSSFGGPAVTAGQTLVASYGSLRGGPVVATSLTGEPALASQRILWAGDSLEEVPATESGKLSDHFYWPWYDQLSPGYSNWIMVANPGASPVYYEITVGGADPGAGSSGVIPAGGSVTPAFPGLRGGPVQVRSYTDNTKTTTATVLASQRVLTNYGRAFNEVPGIPATDISANYLWTWYDSIGAAGSDWIMIANPADGPAGLYYKVKIGAAQQVACAGPVSPNAYAYFRQPGLRDGPVQLTTYSDQGCSTPARSIASQRVIWGPSFEEVPGYPYSSLASTYHWTWYDQSSPGASNWVMVANPTGHPVYYEITLAGANPGTGSTGIIQPGASVIPTFPGKIGGPVMVKGYTDASKTTPENIIASQRVIWNGHFNEVLGSVLYWSAQTGPQIFLGSAASVTSDSAFEVRDGSGTLLASLAAGQVANVVYSGGVYTLQAPGVFHTGNSYIRMASPSGGIMQVTSYHDVPGWNQSLDDNRFRGVIEVRYSPVSNAVWVINELPVESYMKGIAETSSGTPAEFLKTMTVAARSYAIWHLDRNGKYGGSEIFHLKNSRNGNGDDQQYKGYGLEARFADLASAVNATAGQVVTYGGSGAMTPYFSNSDGRTRSALEAWGVNYWPWLQSVADPDCNGMSLNGHGVGLSGTGALARANRGNGYQTILGYYYTGTAVQAVNTARSIRIAIARIS